MFQLRLISFQKREVFDQLQTLNQNEFPRSILSLLKDLYF